MASKPSPVQPLELHPTGLKEEPLEEQPKLEFHPTVVKAEPPEEQPQFQLHSTVVKAEPPEEQPEFELHSTVVKAEPLEEQPEYEIHPTAVKNEQPEGLPNLEYTSFCYETVPKEEVILEDAVEVNDEPESDNNFNPADGKSIKEITEGGAKKCTECGRTFQKNYQLKRHIQWHKAIELGLHRCKYCNREFSFKASLLRHIESHKRIWEELKTGDFAETEQGEPIEGRSSPVRRGKRPQNSSPIDCPECGKVFQTQAKFNGHMARHEAKKQGLFTCDLCNKSFVAGPTLEYHKLIHKKGEKRFTCLTCHEKFESKAALNTHQIIHKTDPVFLKFAQKVVQNEDGVFNCTVCGKFFPNRNKALTHFRKHVQQPTENSTADPPEPELFICDICGIRVKWKSDLRRHMESHKERRRRRTCLVCQMEFETHADCLRHRVVHKTDERSIRFRETMVPDGHGSFTCTVCGKHFDTRDKARMHLRKHD